MDIETPREGMRLMAEAQVGCCCHKPARPGRLANQELAEAGVDSPEPQREQGPANTLTLDLQPPAPRETKPGLLSHRFVYWVTAALVL